MADPLAERLTAIERRLSRIERYLEAISGNSIQVGERVELHPLPGNIGLFVDRLHAQRNTPGRDGHD